MLRRTAFALLSALSLLAGAAQASEPRLEVTPFLGSVASSAWQPFTITVTNPANAPAISGEVRLHLSDQRRGYDNLGNWSRPVQLSPGSSTQVTITANVPYGTLPIAEVTLVQGTGQASSTVASEKFEGLRIRPGNAITVLNLSRNAEALSQIDNLETAFVVHGGAIIANSAPMGSGYGERVAKSSARFRSRVQVSPLAPEELPTDALGLDSVTAVYTDRTTTLTPEQQRVIENYVGSGGLVVTEATDKDSIASQGLGVRASLRPNSVAGWRNALHQRAMQSSVLSGIGYGVGSDYYGLGQVVVVGDGTAPLPFDSLLLFLGAYIVILVPVQYAVLKRLGKREWAWGVTPALAVLFALAAYGFGQRGRSRESFLNVASVVELNAGSATGRALSSVGLFSPSHSNYDLGVKSSGALRLSDTESFGGSAESLVDGVPTLRNLSVPMWSIRRTSALAEVTLGKGLEIKRAGDKVTLTNNTGQTIRALRIGGYTTLNQLEPGQTETVSAPDWRNAGYPLNLYTTDAATQRMTQRLWSLVVSRDTNATITGWLDTSPLTIQLNGKSVTAKHQATMLVVHVP
ncbi:MAG: hypothetical protein QM758_22185 [Armatimonas sp.]